MDEMVEYYNGIAEGYDELYKAEQIDKLEFIRQNFDEKFTINFTDSLLDIGCGTGISTSYFKCKEKTGVDPSPKLIAIAKKNYPDCKFTVTSVENMKTKKSYDFVISLTAAQNFSDIKKAIKNIADSGKDRFVITFLKNSKKRDELDKEIKNNLRVYKILEHEKDIVYFAYSL